MRRFAWISLVAFAGFLASAAEQKPAKLPPEIQQAVGIAMAAPPEFAAEALLRLVEGGNVAGVELKRQLVETAFGLAGRAQHPMRLVAIPGTDADTPTGYEGRALRLKLDAVSLQSRAIEAMLNLDKNTARNLYERFVRTKPAPLNCDVALVPDLSDYYAMLSRLAQSVYNGADNEKNSRVAFVQTTIDQMTSHVEVAPVANMIASLEWSPSQFEIVSGAFVAKLSSLAPDDRSFSFSSHEIESAIAGLNGRAASYNTRPERISEAYRSYIVAQLKAPRCLTAQPLELFGESVRSGLAPLTGDEMRTKRFEGEPKLETYWQSAESKQIFAECLKLRTGPEGAPLPESLRNNREWKRQLSDFLTLLADWRPTAEKSESDYYHQRAIVYEALLELTPPGDVRSRVLDEFVGFLKGSNLQSQDPVQWFWHARSTLNRIRPTQPEEARRMLNAFAASGNVVLSLEAMLDKIAPSYAMFQN